ncbi:MAG: alpha/beta hydrolase [Deltaproteobacteria bacterium]|jgi:pimeloyl-ACP methyl ester carboxylesterase
MDSYTEQYVDVGELRLAVQDWGGSGDTVLFAHPTGFLGAVWAPVVAGLRAGGFAGRVLSYDQRGHGLSSKPDSGYEWERFVADTELLMDELGLEGVLGVGHSAGATTLAAVAAEHPLRFRRLVLVDPIVFDDELRAALGDEPNPLAERTRSRRTVWHSREQIIESYGAREPYGTWTQEALEAYISAGCFERPDGMVELLCPGRIEAQVYEQAPMFDALSRLSRLELPCLVVRGQTSGSFPEERAAKALAAMTDARLVTVADTTHFVPMERPDELARLIACEIDA